MCIINDNHIMYGSWNMGRDKQIFFHFWSLFCSFTPLTTAKSKFWKKWKKLPGDIIILHKGTKNHDHMLQCSPDTIRGKCNFYFSFWAIFFPFTPLTTQKIYFFLKEKDTWRYHHFTHVYEKLWLHDITVPEIWCTTDGRQNKWHIEVGATPNNMSISQTRVNMSQTEHDTTFGTY